MRGTWTFGIIVGALWAGTAVVACGSSGTAVSGGHGGAGSGSGGSGGGGAHTSSASAGAAGGLGFDGGPHGDGSTQDGDACGSVTLQTHTNPGNIVVVFDQSDSMSQPFTVPDAGAGGPKWQVAENAIVAAVTPAAGILNLGAIFFPTKATGNTCSLVDPIGTAPQIKIEPGATFINDFQAHFSATGWALILGTPLKIALDEANAALPDPSPLTGERAVVIITDGAPTCVTGAAMILGPVQAMFSRGIKTYAVGLPGSMAASNLLNQIAMAGGTTSYLSPADPAALQAALSQIATSTIDQCTITLDPPPSDPNLVHLVVADASNPNGYEITEVDGGDGWSLSADGTTATLLGAVCAKAKSGGYSSIQFVYGCHAAPH
jgi:hypothetical protein